MRTQGFPPALRIRKGADFDRAMRRGASAGDDLLVVHAVPNGLPHPRLGLAVGRAVGGSVRRNRVKRLLREAFRTGRDRLPAGHDIVVVAKATAPERWTLEAAARSLADLAAKAAARHARGPARGGKPRG